jgi:hypothetical protein
MENRILAEVLKRTKKSTSRRKEFIIANAPDIGRGWVKQEPYSYLKGLGGAVNLEDMKKAISEAEKFAKGLKDYTSAVDVYVANNGGMFIRIMISPK